MRSIGSSIAALLALIVVQSVAMTDNNEIVSEVHQLSGKKLADDRTEIACTSHPSRLLLLGRAKWNERAGGSGNTYEIFGVTPYISWTEADLVARQLGGYLAVISTAAENQFIFDHFASNSDFYRNDWWGPWLGGRQSTTQPDYSEPHGGWIWANGDTWAYTNWHPGEPSNGNGGVESALCYMAFEGIPSGYWNDWAAQDEWPADTPWTFIVEYDAIGITGDCCVISGCVAISSDDCTALGGTWLGEGGSCDDCPESCAGDTNGDGVVDIEDLLNMMGSWGACP